MSRLMDLYTSYYGGFTCVCWSPDGKYVLTGGQDDLVSIWSLSERQIVARCPGHHSWVTAVAFDPWRCDDRNYRFGSVGEDCRLLLWDFNVGMLHRPKAVGFAQDLGGLISYSPVNSRQFGNGGVCRRMCPWAGTAPRAKLQRDYGQTRVSQRKVERETNRSSIRLNLEREQQSCRL